MTSHPLSNFSIAVLPHLFKVISVREVILTVTSTHPTLQTTHHKGWTSMLQPTFASASREETRGARSGEGSQAFRVRTTDVLLFPSVGWAGAESLCGYQLHVTKDPGDKATWNHTQALLKANSFSLTFSWRKDHAMLPQCFTQQGKPQGNWRLQLVKCSHLCERLLTDLKCK